MYVCTYVTIYVCTLKIFWLAFGFGKEEREERRKGGLCIFKKEKEKKRVKKKGKKKFLRRNSVKFSLHN